MISHSDLASAAFRLALRGVAVFPLSPGTKVPPAGSHGLLDATTDCDVARAVWERTPRANIGAATGSQSGFWCLDVDPQHGGPSTLADLEANHGPLPATIESRTPSGGRHLYWKWDDAGPEIRNSAGRVHDPRRRGANVGPGLDVRGQGGSIIMPPSVLADGRGYRWIENGASTFADAPAWLIALALPPPPPPRVDPKPLDGDLDRYVASAAASELAELGAAQEGTRNDLLNRASFALAGFVKAGALPEDWTRGQLEARAIDAGLTAIEARRTIDSAFRAAQPRSMPR